LAQLIDALLNLGLIRINLPDRERLDGYCADDGQAIPVNVSGRGTPVVLVHGLGCSHRHWKRVARRLSSRHRVFAWDSRGHGKCLLAEAGHITIGRLARDLQNLLDHFGLERAVLVGHSMGALTVMRYLQDFGARRLLAVGIVDQSPRIVTDEHWSLGLFGGCSQSMLLGLIESARISPAETVLREIDAAAGKWAHRVLAPDGAIATWLRNWLERARLAPLLELAESLAEADFRPLLARLNLPLLVVLGGRSPHYGGLPLEAYYRSTVPHASVRVYARSGHSPHYAEPARFARDLAEFVAIVDRFAPDAAVAGSDAEAVPGSVAH
jgi:pimeloyl-ACP methyl ester carboxylesterase